MMKAADLCPDYKVFITPVKQVFERQGGLTDEEFAGRLIVLSETDKQFFIPAISINGSLYSKTGIKVLSDGETEMFIQEGKAAK